MVGKRMPACLMRWPLQKSRGSLQWPVERIKRVLEGHDISSPFSFCSSFSLFSSFFFFQKENESEIESENQIERHTKDLTLTLKTSRLINKTTAQWSKAQRQRDNQRHSQNNNLTKNFVTDKQIDWSTKQDPHNNQSQNQKSKSRGKQRQISDRQKGSWETIAKKCCRRVTNFDKPRRQIP